MSADNTIKLLDGSVWSKEELIHNMDNDEFYYKLCGKNMLSSSNAKLLLDSYKKYYYITKYGMSESQALRDGWLFHTAILEPHVFERQHFTKVKSKNTVEFKAALKEYEGNTEVKVFTSAEKSSAERLADAFLKNSQLVQYLNGAKFEVPIAGEVMGMPFRGKADIITKDGGIIDLKTTTNIGKFKYSAQNFSYDLQCYIYCQLFNVHYKDFYFIAIDKDSLVPKVCSVSEEFYYKGEEKCQRAIDEYKNNINKDLNEYTLWETL
tara:strand:+ start:540 stop:1334 length:795 start_codon:yes stop_codon:yes gene_type:complete